ncbi:hypothetical protein [Bythopirellula polymerisocia]|uniref:hypothetical protein n=1 Tax=Bythopirellula polymerisocia TaxID=2528003 RepID=UPI0011B653FA|nr:hypothetical protein [Bythopirellula polymerisocia]
MKEKTPKHQYRTYSLSKKLDILKEHYLEGTPLPRLCVRYHIHVDQLRYWRSILVVCNLILLMTAFITIAIYAHNDNYRAMYQQSEQILQSMVQATQDESVTSILLEPIKAQNVGWGKEHLPPLAEDTLSVILQNAFATRSNVKFYRTPLQRPLTGDRSAVMKCKILSYSRNGTQAEVDTINLELVLDENNEIIWNTICSFQALSIAWHHQLRGKELENQILCE